MPLTDDGVWAPGNGWCVQSADKDGNWTSISTRCKWYTRKSAYRMADLALSHKIGPVEGGHKPPKVRVLTPELAVDTIFDRSWPDP